MASTTNATIAPSTLPHVRGGDDEGMGDEEMPDTDMITVISPEQGSRLTSDVPVSGWENGMGQETSTWEGKVQGEDKGNRRWMDGSSSEMEEEEINFKDYIAQGKGLESVASVDKEGRISVAFDLKGVEGGVESKTESLREGSSREGRSERLKEWDKLSLKESLKGYVQGIKDLDGKSVKDYMDYAQGVRHEMRGMKDDVKSLRESLKDWDWENDTRSLMGDVEEFAVDKDDWGRCPGLSIVIMIVGSRGDVQPYIALGQQLLKQGHRVRIATHATFDSFVTDAGLEFFSIGGDPQDLMSYMVKNPGLIPGIESLTNGDIKRKRTMLTEMIDGCWRSCHSPDPKTGRAFVADAIISNPPAFAHIHCAEALGVPLLLSFTMPWTPTASFAHPLVNITTSNAGFGLSNYLSYAAADMLTWQGIGDIINTFRKTVLNLEPLTLTTGPGFVDRAKVPWTYCMSPALVMKPADWRSNIDVVGFYFLDLASSYTPPPELAKFLSEGEPPVYIGFGSVVIDNPAAMTKMIFDATQQAGVRALVSAGWGGLGSTTIPPHIHILGNVPHDWLFDNDRVCAVVHHGGAGTTAIGLAMARPTVVVPFFGDQGFWGNMIHKSGAGPRPIPHKDLTVKRLKEAIQFALLPDTKEAAKKLAQSIHDENGVKRGVDSFYKHLPLLNMRCDLEPTKLAVWWSAEHYLKLSAFAAQVLIDVGLIKGRSLVLHRPKEYSASDPSVNFADEAHGLFWSVTHPTGLTEVFQGKPKSKRERSVSPNPSHGLFNALASVHEGFHDPLKPRQIPKVYEPTPSSNVSSSESSDAEKKGRTISRNGKQKANSDETAVVASRTTATTTVAVTHHGQVSRGPKHRQSSSLTETIFNAFAGSAGSASENLMGIARQGTSILNNVNTIITTKRLSQSEKDKKWSDSAASAFRRWKAVQVSTGKPQEREIRAMRIEYGKEAAKASTKAQRAYVVSRFHEEVTQTSARRKKYAESIKKAMLGGGEELEGDEDQEQSVDQVNDVVLSLPMTLSPTSSPIRESHSFDTTQPLASSASATMFREPLSRDPSFPAPTFGPVPMQPSPSMINRHPLSPFVSAPVDGEDDDAVFIREMEEVLRISTAEAAPGHA